MRSRIERAREDDGFTLIELLVVIIIIGILAAIAIPVFLQQRKKGYEASEKSDLRTVANQMETYFTDGQVYPAASTVTSPSTGKLVVGTGGDTVSLSASNTIAVVYSGQNGFCLSAQNSKVATSVNWIYDSLAGGVKKGTAASCSSSSAY